MDLLRLPSMLEASQNILIAGAGPGASTAAIPSVPVAVPAPAGCRIPDTAQKEH